MKTELFERIESPTFSALINVVSGYRQLLKTIAAQPECAELMKWATESSCGVSNASQILSRIYKLASESHDDEVENPFDVAMAVYLRVLNEVTPDFARMAASKIWECKNCWWSHQVANEIQSIEEESEEGITPEELVKLP